MPIRIWNEPGGPVQWGEDWGFKEKPLDMTEEEWQAYLAERQVGKTPSGRFAGYGGGKLDMTKPGNERAIENVMSRRSPFEGLSSERVSEAMALADQGMSPDEMTARRLSRPRFETNTLEIGEERYPMTEMIEPSESDLGRSAEMWKMSGHPLEQEYASARTEGALAEAAKDRALAEGYSKPEVPTGPSSEIMRGLLDNMVKMLENDPEFQALPYDQKMAYLMRKYEELFGARPEKQSFGGIGRMRGSSGASGAESALDEAMS